MGSVYRKQSATGSLKMKKALTIILAVLIQTAVFAQFTQRQSFNTVKEVHDFGEKKLCICNFCAFLVDEDSQIQYLSKSKTGLSAADLSCGGAEENGKYFCIGYNSGDIDIFFEGKDRFQIKNNELYNNKINSIYCSETLIAAATKTGVSLIGVEKKDFLGNTVFPSEVLKIEIHNNRIFAQTPTLTYSIDINDINPQDFSRWKISEDFSFKEFNGNINDYKYLIKNTIRNDNINFLSTSYDGKVSTGGDFWAEITKGGVNNNETPNNEEFTCCFYNPYNSNHVFFGTLSGKLYEYQNFSIKSVYDNPTYLQGRILDMECNSNGDLFVLTPNNVAVFDHNGTWHQAHPFDAVKNYNPLKIKKITDNIFWIIIQEGGILAVDLKSTPLDFNDDEFKIFYPKNSSGQRIGNSVTEVCKASDNKIWVGTDKGICTIESAEKVFKENFSFVKPIITESFENQEDYSQYLLNTKQITGIICDGKSRKWISTINSGVFVVSDSGSEEILRFNKENSELPSDTVYYLKYCGKNGEVFFSTSCGLASFMSDTQDTQKDLKDVKIYPNPVREDYEGEIFISGLEDNCDIRITDIAGNLVYKTKSIGGKISWDGKNLNSNRCATGVYLIFITGLDSKNTTVKKLLMIK